MVNVAELERVLAYCRDNPDSHDQGMWFCDTTACYAGHAAFLNGWKPHYWNDSSITASVTKDGVVKAVPIVAQKIFGLNGDQAELLFYKCHNFDELELAVKDIINEAESSGHRI